MKPKIYLFAFAISIFIGSSAIAQTWQWATDCSISPGGSNQGKEVCYDHHGYMYVGGDYNANYLVFDNDTISCTVQPAGFIAKYDLAGNFQKAKSVDLFSRIDGLVCNPNGDLFVCGTFHTATVKLDSIQLHADGTHGHTFLAKYNSAGKILWARNDFYSLSMDPVALNMDSHGNLNMVGYFSYDLTFGGVTYPYDNTWGTGTSDGFIARFDSSGNPIWARTMTGVNTEYFYSSASAPNDDIYITGSFSSPVITVDGATYTKMDTTVGTMDGFLLKFDSNGNLKWIKTGGCDKDVIGTLQNEVKVDEQGNALMTGVFYGLYMVFDGQTVLGKGACNNGFLVKYNSSGQLQWIKSSAGTNHNEPRSLVLDAYNNIYVFGWFGGTITFGSQSLTAVNMDMFLVKYDPSANPLWAVQAGGSDNDVAEMMCADNNGDLYVTGRYVSDINFGSHSLANSASFFFAKLANPVGVNEVSDSKGVFKVYPNPSNGPFTVSGLKSTVNGTIDVYNTLGEKVYTEAFNPVGYSSNGVNGKEKTVECKLRAGIYFVRVADEKNNWTGKIVVE